MYRIAVCENDELCMEEIKQILSNLLKKRGIRFELDTFISGEEFCEHLDSVAHCDMFFLDIEMEKISGIEVAKKVKEINENALIAFV